MSDLEIEVSDTDVLEVLETEETKATDEVTENDDSESSTAEEAESPKPDKRDSRAEKRIKQLTRQKHEAEARYQELLVTQESPNPQKLDRESFEHEEDYLDAVFKQRDNLQKDVEEKGTARAQEVELLSLKNDVVNESQEQITNFNQSRFDRLDISGEMAIEIAYSDSGADILTHLYKNPDIASKIADMPETRHRAAITRLEIQLESGDVKTKTKSTPIKPVGSGGKSSKVFSADMSQADYNKWRDSGGSTG